MIASPKSSGTKANVKASAQDPNRESAASARLRACGLRVTGPRSAILAVLLSRDEPASIEQIHSEVGHARCDVVTVYRCMAAFEEIGLVHRSGFIDGTCLYEIDSGGGARYRVVCRHTRRVRDVDPEDASALAEAVRQVEETLRAKGFTEVGHIVEFFGTAPEAENAPA